MSVEREVKTQPGSSAGPAARTEAAPVAGARARVGSVQGYSAQQLMLKPGPGKAEVQRKPAPVAPVKAGPRLQLMKGGDSVATQQQEGKGAYADPSTRAEERAEVMNVDISQLNTLPDSILGDYQRQRVIHALGALNATDFGVFQRLVGAAASLSEKGFLFKALAANSPMSDITWLAGQIAGKDQNWLIDNCTLGDPRAQGTGVEQQYTHSCGPSTTVVMRGNYDPVFALRTRQANPDVSQRQDANAELSTRERTMLEGGGGTAVRSGAGGVGMWATGEMDNQQGATGLNFTNVRDPTPAQALEVLDDRVPAGMQVPTVIGYAPRSYQHYVLCMHRRTVAGQKEYQFHNTGGADTVWQTENQIRTMGMTLNGGNRITALEVPRAA